MKTNFKTFLFTEGPIKGEPFLAKGSFEGKHLQKGDKFYATVESTYGNCRYKGTTRK